MSYLHWDQKEIKDFSSDNIEGLYDRGFVFTRIGRGIMQQTRSVRIDLGKFEPSSENRRIMRKTESLSLETIDLPMALYDWHIGKIAKDFYTEKFGDGIMSAQKIKEILTDPRKSNFNLLIKFSAEAYTICYKSDKILHYSYPFYAIDNIAKDMGLGMMLRAIVYAKEKGLEYIYLGSLQRPQDVYKLQFDGLEWFDGKNWSTDIVEAKNILTKIDK